MAGRARASGDRRSDRRGGRGPGAPEALAGAAGRLAATGLALVLAAAPASAQTNTTPDPVALARADIQASCLKVEYPDNFVQRVDLTGDDRLDVIITYNVTCDGYHSFFCGAAGCIGSVFVARPDGEYEQVELPPSITPTTWNDLPAVAMPRPRSECVGSGPCERIRVWNGRAFVPPSASLAQLAAEAAEIDPAASAPDLPRAAAGVAPAIELGALEQAATTASEAADAEAQEAVEIGELAPEIEALIAEGPQRDSWFLSRSLRVGRVSAVKLGADGRSSMMLSCAPGDEALELSVAPSEAAASRGIDNDGAVRAIALQVGQRVIETSEMRFDRREGAWRAAIAAGGAATRALQRGVTAIVRDPAVEFEYARFDLTNSRRMIDALIAACRG